MYSSPQWINWRIERDGAKVPCDVTTGHRIDPHQPAAWLPYKLARALDPEHVGFVLTDDDPYFCIDLDHAWDGEKWSDLAERTVAEFPGAYVEISHSGDGLHLIGRGVLPEGYGTRGPGVECYVRARFIAITGRDAQGDPDAECDLSAWAAAHLKPAGPEPTGAEWTTAPVPEATIIPDDAELIRRMLGARQSAAVAFGDKASAADLWNGNTAALAEAWPHETKPYDASSADAALAARLAFWTGKDCARMERLMRMSALVREKWDKHQSYLSRTILGAVARCTKVYQRPGSEPDRSSDAYMTAEAQADYFAGCCYVADLHAVLMPNGTIRKPDPFHALMGGHDFEFALGQPRPEKNAFTAFTQSRLVRQPKADTMCFRPEEPPGALLQESGLTLVNSYIPAPVTLGTGPVDLWLNHMGKMLPDERDRTIVISYLAAMRQYPGKKFYWCPLIQGVQGNGKDAITQVAEYIVGGTNLYSHRVNAKELGDSGARFNGWIDRKLLIVVNEIYISDRREILDAIKPLITDDRIEVQRKGADQYTADNRANFILTTNHREAIPKTRDDRRYAIFYTAHQTQEDLQRDGLLRDEYWQTLWTWLKEEGGFADVAGYLQRYAIPDELNPATRCHRAPETSSTEQAIRESHGLVEQAILEACDEGRQGFSGGWVSSIALSRLLDDIRRTVPPRKRGELMESIGYVLHPALHEGRAPMPIPSEDRKRPKLYVARGSIQHLNITDSGEAMRSYCRAQGYMDAAVTPTATG